ncbi:MAG: ABC transporter ATP-binding protein [Stappiaceae bacterium]
MTAEILKVRDLSILLPEGADRTYAVSAANLELKKGETLCLVGESGSGKSVLSQAIMGMLPPQLTVESGDIRFEGDLLPPQRSKLYQKLRSRKIAMIFQDAAASLDPIRRVGHQLEEILLVHGVERASERRDRTMALLRSVRLPDPERIYRSYPHQISGGQAQRVVIAEALALGPDVLIADEPTTALDVTTQAKVLQLIVELCSANHTAVLFVTHDIGVVSEIADTVAVMCDGVIVEVGSRNEVLETPTHSYTRKLLAAVPKPENISNAHSQNSPILRVKNLSRTYAIKTGLFTSRPLTAVQNVSFSLHRGETLGIVGESGSGKSTLARCVLRLEDPDIGTISFNDEDITTVTGAALRSVRSDLQVVLQDPFSALNPRQTVGNAIAEGPLIHGASREEAAGKVSDLLKKVGLPEQAAKRFPHEFSGGQRQRICIARALAVQPKVLIADEAVSALDVSIQTQILDLFRELQAAMGFAMIFITHDLVVAASICDNVLVMRNGNMVEYGTANAIFTRPKETYSQELIAAIPGGIPRNPPTDTNATELR